MCKVLLDVGFTTILQSKCSSRFNWRAIAERVACLRQVPSKLKIWSGKLWFAAQFSGNTLGQNHLLWLHYSLHFLWLGAADYISQHTPHCVVGLGAGLRVRGFLMRFLCALSRLVEKGSVPATNKTCCSLHKSQATSTQVERHHPVITPTLNTGSVS